MTEVRMPKLGEAMIEGTLAEQLIDDGQVITEGAPLYVVHTEKVEMEIEAPAAGVVSWKVAVDGTYAVGTLLAEII